MLVNLYGWTNGILGEQGTYGYADSSLSHPADAYTGGQRNGTNESPTVIDMREEISVSLARLSGLRGDLLDRWDLRNEQTNKLEAAAESGTIASVGPGRSSVDVSSATRGSAQSPNSLLRTTPVSSSGIEYREGHHRRHRIHKIQKSVGGRLRDLLGSGSSSRDLASLEKGGGSERSKRNSFDVSVLARPGAISREKLGGGQAILEEGEVSIVPGIDGTKSSPLPSLESSSMPTRPVFPSRRSMNLSSTEVPFLVDSSLFPIGPPSSSHGQELRSSISSQGSSAAPVHTSEAGLGLGLPTRREGGGHLAVGQQKQEVEELEEVGRKKEGVLWGGGTWEDVGRQGKTRWEKYWVVLDHSSIYEVSVTTCLQTRVACQVEKGILQATDSLD